MEERTEDFARRMADFQADNSPSWSHYAQHLTESLTNIGQIAYSESGTAAVNAVIRQINMFGISNPQLNLVLQPQTSNFSASHIEHFRCNVHADHARSWPGTAHDRNREVSCSSAQVESEFASTERQVASGKCTPALIQPKTHQAIHGIVDASYFSEKALYVGAFASCFPE